MFDKSGPENVVPHSCHPVVCYFKPLAVFLKFCLLSGDRARRSPRKLPTAMKEEKKKWVMPKFLPHKYDVKLINEDKVCHIIVILLPVKSPFLYHYIYIYNQYITV